MSDDDERCGFCDGLLGGAEILSADAKGYDRGVADVLALVEKLALHFRDYPATTVANAMACVRPNVLRGKHVGLSLPKAQEPLAIDAERAEAFNAKLAAINTKAKDLLAKLEAPKDHAINLTGLRGVGPWVGEVGPWIGEGLTKKADKLHDAYRDTKAEAHRLAEVYRRQYPDAKAFRVGPRKRMS